MAKDSLRLFLESAREARYEYERAVRRVEVLTARCERITTVLRHAPSGNDHTNGGSTRLWAALADEREKAAAIMYAALEKEKAVEEFIDSMPDPLDRLILKLRYVDLLRWPDMLAVLQKQCIPFCSSRHLYRKHGEALNRARKIWAEQHKEGPEE